MEAKPYPDVSELTPNERLSSKPDAVTSMERRLRKGNPTQRDLTRRPMNPRHPADICPAVFRGWGSSAARLAVRRGPAAGQLPQQLPLRVHY
jgi:hypothetical protein